MLQQTQVKTVLPRYKAWFKQFPSIATLANASEDELLKAWEGLGYYRRARFIHKVTHTLMADFDGKFPRSFDDMITLPGIGRSTAGAIASFCYGASTPVLDGNVKRVLKRWYSTPAASEKELWTLAQQEIDSSSEPATWNQAMMELGATLCSTISPACSSCPVNRLCGSAHQEVKSSHRNKKPVKNVYWRVHLYTCHERGIWLQKRPDFGIWGGLWSPPISEMETQPDEAPLHIHQLTHRRLNLYAKRVNSQPDGDGRWVLSTEELALPTGIHKLLEKIA